MDDPDGDDAGTWSYELDASAYDGGIELTARGLDTATRYGVWSPTVALQVDNPSASVPEVTITSPAEGVSLRGMVWVEVQAASALPVSHVQIRLNHGEWQEAKRSGTKYVYGWNTAKVGNRTVSLEVLRHAKTGGLPTKDYEHLQQVRLTFGHSLFARCLDCGAAVACATWHEHAAIEKTARPR